MNRAYIFVGQPSWLKTLDLNWLQMWKLQGTTNLQIGTSLIKYMFRTLFPHLLGANPNYNLMQVWLSACFEHLFCTSLAPLQNLQNIKTPCQEQLKPFVERHVVTLVILSPEVPISFSSSFHVAPTFDFELYTLWCFSKLWFWRPSIFMLLQLVLIVCFEFWSKRFADSNLSLWLVAFCPTPHLPLRRKLSRETPSNRQ